MRGVRDVERGRSSRPSRNVEACLSNALRAETHIHDAERENDTELTELFRKAQADSRTGAELGKRLLRTRLGG